MSMPGDSANVRRWAPPPWGSNGWILLLAQITGAGLVVPIVGAALLLSFCTEYDGLVTLIGTVIVPVVIAIPSIAIALLLGLPVRFIPAWRRTWWAHGGATLVVTAAGLVVAIVGLGLSHAAVGAASTSLAGWWVLLAGWIFFCLGAVHFVWPKRWSGIVTGAARGTDSRAPFDARRTLKPVDRDLGPR